MQGVKSSTVFYNLLWQISKENFATLGKLTVHLHVQQELLHVNQTHHFQTAPKS